MREPLLWADGAYEVTTWSLDPKILPIPVPFATLYFAIELMFGIAGRAGVWRSQVVDTTTGRVVATMRQG